MPELNEDMNPRALALYVHWPFCRAKCPYCDFNSHVRPAVDHERWARALVRELETLGEAHAGRELVSIFFGGGTPSLMEPATVAAVIEAACRLFRPADGLEITLEANPTSVEAGKFKGFAAAGVNRVSLGVQALDDTDLRFLGREHSAAEALDAVALAARHFPRFSFDMIYARPGQTPEAWARELEQALEHAVGHISAYQLTIEPRTRFHAMAAAGHLRLPPDDVQADLYEITQEVLGARGLHSYEVSNHARPGEACRHNLVYWRCGDYLGIGPGAHGRLTGEDGARLAVDTERMPDRWLAAVEEKGHAIRHSEPVEPADRLAELLLMGLRLGEGVPIARIEAIAGAPLEFALDGAGLRLMEENGLVTRAEGRLRATREGRLLLNGVIERLLPDGS